MGVDFGTSSLFFAGISGVELFAEPLPFEVNFLNRSGVGIGSQEKIGGYWGRKVQDVQDISRAR